MELLEDLQEFFQAFSSMAGGFRERARRVNELLESDQTWFLVVCGPQGEPTEEAVYFHRKLVEAKLPFGAVIVNKVHPLAEVEPDEGLGDAVSLALGESADEAANPERLASRVVTSFSEHQTLAVRDAKNIRRLAREMKARRVIIVPYLDEDVHDLAGLLKLDRYLFAGEPAREALTAG